VCKQQYALLCGVLGTDARDDVAVVRLAVGITTCMSSAPKPAALSRVSAARTTFVQEPVDCEESISTISL
jgi:hypothetical protein